ncbi:uncharacterized protein LOC127812471 isoform X2 [Diospyros lotus]|nr:uncharacterized protein LOC127812471 isoform X2 [Diospyros lotus]
MQKRRQLLMKKYDGEWNDPKIFQWKYGKQYLIPREICDRLSNAWREDRWLLLEAIREKRSSALTKHEQRIADHLLKKLNESETTKGKLLPAWTLLGVKDYHVKRRLGPGGGHYKEIHWFGEGFALRNFFGEIDEKQQKEISLALSVSHPCIAQYLCAFYDEKRKEGFLLMELMNNFLGTYIKENSGQRKRNPFSLPVAVDIMLQIARGMEYLHSQKIYHGDLNPSNILLKARNSSAEGYFCAKVAGFGLTSIKTHASRSHANQNVDDPVIWYAPEVLAEQEQHGGSCSSKYTEKADVYSFGMLCFEILTGKTPFEEAHLQEDTVARNIRAGERPLFPYASPKSLVNFTRKCWQAEPTQRPSFPAICRILRYIKKYLVINPNLGQPESPPPLVDYCEIETGYSKLYPGDGSHNLAPVSQVPFQMFAYRLVEKEKTSGNYEKLWDLAGEVPSLWGPASGWDDDNGDLFSPRAMDQRSVYSDVQDRRIGADRRSVHSEALWMKGSTRTAADGELFRPEFLRKKTDLRAVGSMTPGRKFLPSPAASCMLPSGGGFKIQRSVSCLTPGGLILAADQRSTGSESSDEKSFSDYESSDGSETLAKTLSSATAPAVGQVSPHLWTAVTTEKKIPSSTAANGNSFGSRIRNRPPPLLTAAVDRLGSEVSRNKILSRTVSSSIPSSPANPALPSRTISCSIPNSPAAARVVLPSIASESNSDGSNSPETQQSPGKAKSVYPVIPNTKVSPKREALAAQTKKSPVLQRAQSTRSSALRVPKVQPPQRSSPNLVARCSRSIRERRQPWL